MNNIKKYTEFIKIAFMEDVLCRELTQNEKIAIKNQFYSKIINFALKNNFDFEFLIEDIHILSNIDELLDISEERAVKFVNQLKKGDLNE